MAYWEASSGYAIFYVLDSRYGCREQKTSGKTHVVGFSACLPLATPTSHILPTYHAETAGIPFLPLK